ncbi:ArgE/DapE family deacylase [Marinobacterium stanieri]|uniref:Acetylornithine deacetylase n=1 Tax=Marinobacterium stanieri TaxID=49186 RepID=A0A1N6NBR7_9GAMM|nr:ArgE/DapE family deacylase [Marinobacterium stanieri]SIP89500.1 acetylornithine deacetylase [Marinobacterium stanieri]
MSLAEHEQQILKSCDQVFDDAIAFTKDMVRQYAVLNQEQGVLNVVEGQLNDLGLPAQRVEMKHDAMCGHSLYAPVEWDHENKYNLVSQLNRGEEGKTLVLNGHLDVVSADPPDMWTHLPNEPWEKDGWLYGRGAGDMQSGVAAMIYAVHAVRHAGFEIKSPLTIQAVVEEECSGNGALACLQQGFGGDFVLIPEPFGPQIYTGQVGVLWFKVVVRGKPAHVLDTSAGQNAIEKLQLLIPWLKSLEDELNSNFRASPYDAIERPFNLNIGTIQGGNWASSVPSHAQMEGRIGFPPGMSANEIMQRVNDCIEQAARTEKAFVTEKPVLRFHGFRSEGHLVDMADPGINLLSGCHESLTQERPKEYLSTCTTDLRAFHFYSRTAGTCYGPVARNIHGIDESVDIESIRHVLKTYALFISRWCKLEPA